MAALNRTLVQASLALSLRGMTGAGAWAAISNYQLRRKRYGRQPCTLVVALPGAPLTRASSAGGAGALVIRDVATPCCLYPMKPIVPNCCARGTMKPAGRALNLQLVLG